MNGIISRLVQLILNAFFQKFECEAYREVFALATAALY